MRRHWAILRDYPKLTKDTPTGLIDLVNTFIKALENFKAPVTYWDLPINDLILSTLHHGTIWQWELTLTEDDIPSQKKLLKFLEKKSQLC